MILYNVIEGLTNYKNYFYLWYTIQQIHELPWGFFYNKNKKYIQKLP